MQSDVELFEAIVDRFRDRIETDNLKWPQFEG